MKAILYRRTGCAHEVLSIEELPDPQPAAGEVRIRVQFSGVNPSDTKSRAGISTAGMPYDFVVPHSDGAGVIDAAGDGVPASLVGKRVWFFNAQWQRQFGSAAEYVCLPLGQVVDLPDGLPAEVGASIGIPLLTAHHATSRYGDLAGKTVLVTGGAGSVGFFAIQLARLAGARVITTVSTGEKAKWAAAARPDLILPYANREHLVDDVMQFTNGQGVDALIDVNASDNASVYPRLLALGGNIVIYGSREASIPLDYRGMMRRLGSVQFFLVYLLGNAHLREGAAICTGLLEAELIRPVPTVVFTPEKAADAHQFVESGRPGKALIRMSLP